jgi:hypothetical protein
MGLELEFKVPGETGTKASATITLNRFTEGESGLPQVSTMCATMGELEGQLKMLEGQIANIRREAQRKFVMAGISN